MRDQLVDQEAPDQVDGADGLNIENDSQVEEIHTNEQQLDEGYRWIIQRTLVGLLVILNHNFVTEMTMSISDAEVFLTTVDKMPRLSSITLERDDVLPRNAILIITEGILRHRYAFPGKPALKVNFHGGWHHLHFHAPHLSVPEIMMKCMQLQLPQTSIYQALNRPVVMTAGEYTSFYDHCQYLELDHLRSFRDSYLDRCDNGEGPTREAFLKRCTALESLNLGVGTLYDLSWAAQYATSGTSAASGLSVHPKMRNLTLESFRSICFLVHAMNDAMMAYAGSLRLICAYSNYHSEDEFGVPEALQNARKALERRLRTDSLACMIGNWVFKLPCLTTLTFVVSGSASLAVGSLSQCPNLENLTIRFGGLSRPPPPPSWRTGRQDNSSLSRQCLNVSLRKSTSKLTALFPKWSLPRLRTLHLTDSAALRFNYESLDSIPALESLALKVFDMNSLVLQFRHRIPKLAAHDSQPAPSARDQGQIMEQGEGDSAVWTPTWHLPYLKKLDMVGPPAHVFNLDWLKACPQLSIVHLATFGPLQRIPAHAHSAPSYSIPAAPEPRRRETRATMAPLLDSVLEFIFLEGPWSMTRGDMVELLTVYAPHLQKLNVGVLNDRKTFKGCGYRTIKAISVADAINRAYIEKNVPEYLELLKEEYRKQDSVEDNQQEGEAKEEEQEQRGARLNRLRELARLVPGQKLTTVKSQCRVSKWGCRDLGLESCDVGFKKPQSATRNSEGKIQLGLGRAQRVYKFSGQELWHLES